MSRPDASRRRFLRTAALTSIAGAGGPFALNLAAISAALAQSAPNYRALVCVFLNGGNDHANMVLATDPASWAAYNAARTTPPDPIALAAPGAPNGVLPIVPNTAQPGRSFALHPSMQPLRQLFDDGRAAVVANVGPLIAPITKAQWQARSVPRPPQLFSHNDQTSIWQAYRPEGARVGWGGRMGDLMASMNPYQSFTCISASGNAVFLSGETTMQFQASNSGSVQVGGLTGGLFGTSAANNPLRAIVTADRANLFEKEHSSVVRRAIDAQAALTGSMVPAASLPAPPQNNGLAQRLQTVARIIGGRGTLGMRRQVFFVSVGGFDTHDKQTGNHANLMSQLAQAMAYFDQLLATPAINALDDVTLFTASEFGRTLTSNGDGTDHGWGAHHLVSGGGVSGKDLYGWFPEIGVDTVDDVGSGRLIPRLAVDQYAATLARWFGVADGQLNDLFPNLPNFGSDRNIGFMRA